MAKARKRKDTQFKDQMVKSVFLYGNPNKEKADKIKAMQHAFVEIVNDCIKNLYNTDGLTEYLIKNDSRASEICKLKKVMRPEKVNTAYCQLAFDMAFTNLANRLDNIRQDMYAENQNIFTASKILFAMSVDKKTKAEMSDAMKKISKSAKSKKDSSFHDDCAKELDNMEDSVFEFMQVEFQDMYNTISLEYKMPVVKRAQIPLDSRIMSIEPSNSIEAPYVISISNMLEVRGEKIVVPLNTSKHSLNKIKSHDMAKMVSISMDIQRFLKVGWSYKNTMSQPKTSDTVGVDVGISDTFHTSDDKAIGSMKPVLDFYKNVVEKSFASLSDMRNKKKKIKHYLHRHNLPEDVRRSLIQKMDRLDQMIQKAEAPYRKKRCYYEKLDHEIKSSVRAYIKSINHNTLTVLEKLDIKEFNKSRKANGMMSTFARGKLQKKLMETLNWYGYDFKEVLPDYTSQTCPVCSYLDKENRDNKNFKCKCCGYEADADYVGSLNIKARADDEEILGVCERYKYNHSELQKNLKIVYKSRNEKYKAAASVSK